VHSLLYVLSAERNRSKSRDCTIKTYFISHQLLAPLSQNANTAIQRKRSYICYSRTRNALLQLMHETTKERKQLQRHPSISTRRTERKKALLTHSLPPSGTP